MRWRTVLPLSALAAVVQAAYSLEQTYAGDSFYDGWSFWGNNDNLTNGASALPPPLAPSPTAS